MFSHLSTTKNVYNAERNTYSMMFDSYLFVEARTLHLMSNNSHVLVVQFCGRHVNSEFGSTICGRHVISEICSFYYDREGRKQCSTLFLSMAIARLVLLSRHCHHVTALL